MINNTAHQSCLEKQLAVKALFEGCANSQMKYEKIIELGRKLPAYPSEFKTPHHLVKGCQSTLYLYAQLKEGKVQFQAYSEALISSGLAALLLLIYNDESPETILTCSPAVFEQLDLQQSLSPSRSNGLASLLQRMKQEALNFLVPKK